MMEERTTSTSIHPVQSTNLEANKENDFCDKDKTLVITQRWGNRTSEVTAA